MFLAFALSMIVVLFLLLLALSRDADETRTRADKSSAVSGGRLYVLNINGPALFVVPREPGHAIAPLQIDHDIAERPRPLRAITGGRHGVANQPAAVLTVVKEYHRED